MVDFFALNGGKTAEQTQNGGDRILKILLILIISMCLSACTVGNDHEDIFTASDITDTHSEPDSADTQVWNSAVTSGIFVRFDNVELSLDEILSMAEQEYNPQNI